MDATSEILPLSGNGSDTEANDAEAAATKTTVEMLLRETSDRITRTPLTANSVIANDFKKISIVRSVYSRC